MNSFGYRRRNCRRNITQLWLRQVKFCFGDFIIARVRRSRDGRPHSVMILVKKFFHRVHKAFAAVSVFWFGQVRAGTCRRNLSPVSVFIQRECSWIFGFDTSDKGAFLLRYLLGGELGYYSLSNTPESEIRRSIVLCGRSLPVFQSIIDHTPGASSLCVSM